MSFWDGIVCDLFLCLLRENEHTMTELYLNKYRVPSARAQWWNYADNASYFITICTANRQHYFGKIKNQNMELSDIGSFATKCWFEIPQHFPFVQLGAFIVMPNHVHGIVIIQKPENAVETLHATSSIREMLPIPETSSIREMLPISATSSIRETLPIPETSSIREMLPIPGTSSIREILPIPETSSIREMLPIPETSSIREILPISETSSIREMLPIPETSSIREMLPISATSSIREILPIPETSSIREMLPISETSSIRETLPILPTMETLPIHETLHATSLPAKTTIYEKREFMSKISPDAGAIPTVLRSFKSAVTRMANLNKTEFGWQTRFHDRIIRDEKEYQRINDYIETNPLNWQKDKFYCE